MHTINGYPATYFKDEQICYCGGRGKKQLIHLTKSLKKIKLEQKKSNIWRIKQGFKTHHDYGYVRIVT